MGNQIEKKIENEMETLGPFDWEMWVEGFRDITPKNGESSGDGHRN